MGYSITIQFPDAQSRDQMLKFLIANHVPLNTLVGEEYSMVRGPTDDPSYDGDKKNLIGYDFSLSGDLQSRVAFLICYWVKRQNPTLTIWYDGTDPEFIPEDCDEHGFRPLASTEIYMYKRKRKPWDLLGRAANTMGKEIIKEISQYDHTVHSYLKELTKQWNMNTSKTR